MLTQFSVAFRVFSWVLVWQPLTIGYWRTWKSLTSCVSEAQEGPHSQMISNIRKSKVSHVPFSFYFFCAPSVQNFHPSLGGQNVFNHIWQCFVLYGKRNSVYVMFLSNFSSRSRDEFLHLTLPFPWSKKIHRAMKILKRAWYVRICSMVHITGTYSIYSFLFFSFLILSVFLEFYITLHVFICQCVTYQARILSVISVSAFNSLMKPYRKVVGFWFTVTQVSLEGSFLAGCFFFFLFFYSHTPVHTWLYLGKKFKIFLTKYPKRIRLKFFHFI